MNKLWPADAVTGGGGPIDPLFARPELPPSGVKVGRGYDMGWEGVCASRSSRVLPARLLLALYEA